MPEFFTNYSAGIPKQTSLADLIGNMSALQKYNQETQLMPIQLEGAKAELEKAQQGAAKGGIELSQTRQANQENLAVQEAIRKNPQSFMTNGRFDPDKLMQQLPSLAPMTHTDYIKKYTEAMDSAAKAESSVSKLSEDRRAIGAGYFKTLAIAGVTDPKIVKDILDYAKETHKNDKGFGESMDALGSLFKNAKRGPEVTAGLHLAANALMPIETQIEKLAPEAGTQDVGGTLQEIIKRKSVLGEDPSIQQTGQAFGKTLAPQVFANQITGAPQILGGGASSPRAPQGAPTQQSVAQPVAQGVLQTAQPTFARGSTSSDGQLTQAPNESPANFNARVAETQNLYRSALDQYNNPQSKEGHIPTLQNLNKNIMDLLKDKSVNTGAISDYLANKTNKGSLNPKEQELAKFLQQRIENMGARSDQAANNLKNAYGSFNLDKEALKEIVRNDNVFLTTRDLMAKGILHNATNPTNPSNPKYGAAANFNAQFAPYAANATLMKYISLVGEGKKVHLDDEDKTAFHNFIGKMPKDQRERLEELRQEALGYVNPGAR